MVSDLNYNPLILWALKYFCQSIKNAKENNLLNQLFVETKVDDYYSNVIMKFSIFKIKEKKDYLYFNMNNLMTENDNLNESQKIQNSILLLNSKEITIIDFLVYGHFNEINKLLLFLLFEKNSELLYEFQNEFVIYTLEENEVLTFQSINKYIYNFIETRLHKSPEIFRLKDLLYNKEIEFVNEIGKDKNGVFIEFLEVFYKLYSSYDTKVVSIGVISKDNTIFNFSSGDTAYYSFLGRIILALKDQLNNGNSNLLLLLDEVDIALHPSRQKALFKTIIDAINDTCSGYTFNKEIEIYLVITTHSPFLASDIPSQNIVYLKVDEEQNDKGQKVQISTQDCAIENSFAANIHMIYKNSFYLEKGLIGDFAVEKIKAEILNKLYAGSIILNDDKLEINRIKKHIDLIGDKALKFQMMEDLDKIEKIK